MGNKRVIVFFLIGIALCLVILIAGRKNRRYVGRPDKISSLLLRDIFDELNTVVIEHNGQRIELRRDGSRWKMLAPVEASVDQGAMMRFLNGFDSVVVKDRLGFDEIKKRGLSVVDYGLYPARARVVLIKPEREVAILFGGLSASTEDVYVRKGKRDEVLVVSADVYDVIPVDANDLRSRRLIDCDKSLVSSIDIRRPGHPFIRLVKERGAWLIEQPVNAPAAVDRVEKFLDDFFEVRVFQFVWPTLDNVMDVADYESALKMRKGLYGLDDESGTAIHIHTVDGSSEANVVIGHHSENISDPVYALINDSTAIGSVSNSFADVVNLTPQDFRSMRIFTEIYTPLRRLQISHGEDLFVLSQTNGIWSIDSPASEPADQEVVHTAIEQMLALEAERIETKKIDDANSEIKGGSSQLEFQSGDKLSKASVRKMDLEGSLYEIAFAGSTELFYVSGSNMPPTMVRSEAVLEFRDKTLLALPRGSVSRVTIKKFGETAVSFEYVQEDQRWLPVAEDMQLPLNGDAFEKSLALLSGFRADKVVKIGMTVDDYVYFGFKEPWLEINLDVTIENAVRKTLLVGRSAGFNLRYVMVRGDQSVFIIDEQRLNLVFNGVFTGEDQ